MDTITDSRVYALFDYTKTHNYIVYSTKWTYLMIYDGCIWKNQNMVTLSIVWKELTWEYVMDESKREKISIVSWFYEMNLPGDRWWLNLKE